MSLPFESGFDDPTLADWNGKEVWSGSLKVVPELFHKPLYSLKCIRSAGVGGFARQAVVKNLGPQQIVYARLYAYFTALPTTGPETPGGQETGNNIYVSWLTNSVTGNVFAAPFIRTDPSWNYNTLWNLNHYSGGKQYAWVMTPLVEALRWYCIEIMAKRASASGVGNGEARLWVDERLLIERLGLYNYDVGAIDKILIGQPETTPFYLVLPEIITYVDTVKIATTGPIGAVPSVQHDLILESSPMNVATVLNGVAIGTTPITRSVGEGQHTPEVPYEREV